MMQTMLEQPAESDPVGYSLLKLPTKRELRKKGFNVEEVNTNSCREHPLAKWTTHALQRGATYRTALDLIEEANKNSWGLLKARIHFSDGSFDSYARTNPNDPLTIKNTRTYDPNGVFKTLTKAATMTSRELLLPRLHPISDERGHHLCSKAIPKTFSPQVLYRDCPPPVHSQAGYDFSPSSHTAFLLRPGDHPQGVRDVKSDFMKGCTDYRPRSYLRNEVSGGLNSRHCHCAEVFQVGDHTMDMACATDRVNQRNRVVSKEFTKIGTVKPHSTIVGKRNAKAPAFPCTHQPRDLSAGGANASGDAHSKGNDSATDNGACGGAPPVAESSVPSQPPSVKSNEQRSVRFDVPPQEAVAA